MPRRDPEAGQSWGIFGGAFDPVHRGHLTLATDVYREAKLDGIFFVPSRIPPHRPVPCVASYKDRVEMLRLALGSNDQFIVSTIELELPPPGYSLVVIRELKRRYPGVTFRMVIGADNLTTFWNWHCPQDILKELTVLAGARPSFDQAAIKDFPAGAVRFVSSRLIDVSSSGIRESIKSGVDRETLVSLVPDEVATYIIEKGLYR